MPMPKCEICDDDFSKCCHTLCEGCIKQLLNNRRIVCPFCREPTEVPGNNIKSLHKNFSLIQMIQLTQTTVVEEVEASIVPKCKAHPYNLAEFVCVKPACSSNDKLMCRTCEDYGVHKGHKKELLITRMETSRNSLQKAISDLQKQLRDIDQNVEALKKAQTSFNESGELFQKKKNQITSFYSKLREKVNEREKEALSELKKVAQTARMNESVPLQSLLEFRSTINNLIVEAVLKKTKTHRTTQYLTYKPTAYDYIIVNIRPIEVPIASIEYCAEPGNSSPSSSTFDCSRDYSRSSLDRKERVRGWIREQSFGNR